MALKEMNKYIKNTQQQCVFPEIMTWLLKIIHRPCREQFHQGAIFFLLNYTYK